MMPGAHHSGQTLNDRITAARYALAGQGLARAVCKATTEEMIAPKKKHIDYLLQCTEEPNVSIPHLANLLIERTQHSSWIVVFKALITVHHLMCYGNERFTQYLASSNSNFQLNNYLDKAAPKGYDMSVYIRRYARYINAKALSYRTVAFDFTKVKRGNDGQFRQMGMEKLLKTIPVLQDQIDALLEFNCDAGELTNGVISAAFFLLFKDLIRLFACYNDGIITTLEKYFELTNKKMARESLDIYKKFLIRMDKVAEFLKTAENCGIDRGDIPDLTKAPSSLLEAMEHHLAALEGKKPGTTSNGEKNTDETVVKKAIEEEEKFLNKLKEKHLQEKKVHNPFLAMSSPSKSPNDSTAGGTKKPEMVDLFGSSNSGASNGKSTNADDLFSLDTNTGTSSSSMAANNPFADILSSLSIPAAASNTGTSAAASGGGSSEFATSDGFAAAFGSSSNSNIVMQLASIPPPGFDAFGDVLQPQNVKNTATNNLFPSLLSADATNNNVPSSVLGSTTTANNSTVINNNVPTGSDPGAKSSTSGSFVKPGDLDATLANLAQNLDINGLKSGSNYKKGQQFNPSPKSTIKTGGGSIGSVTNHGSGSVSPSSILWNTGTGATTNANTSAVPVPPPSAWNAMIRPGPTMINSSWAGGVANPSMVAQPATLMPAAMSNAFPSMRPASMLPGAVPMLPAGVSASTLSSILAGKTSPSFASTNNQSATASTTTSAAANNSQSIDPFGAL